MRKLQSSSTMYPKAASTGFAFKILYASLFFRSFIMTFFGMIFCWVFDTFLIYWIYVFISFTRSGGFWHPTFKYSVTFTSSFPSASAQYDHLTLYYSHSPSSLSSFIPVHFLYSIIWVLFYLLLSLLWSSTYYLLAFIWRLSDP